MDKSDVGGKASVFLVPPASAALYKLRLIKAHTFYYKTGLKPMQAIDLLKNDIIVVTMGTKPHFFFYLSLTATIMENMMMVFFWYAGVCVCHHTLGRRWSRHT